MRWRVVTWNVRGLWLTRRADRERKLAWIAAIMAHDCDVLCLQETHLTEGVWGEFLNWCHRRKLVPWGRPAKHTNDGLCFLTAEATETLWEYTQLDPDVMDALTSIQLEDEGSTIYNNRFDADSAPLRVQQINA